MLQDVDELLNVLLLQDKIAVARQIDFQRGFTAPRRRMRHPPHTRQTLQEEVASLAQRLQLEMVHHRLAGHIDLGFEIGDLLVMLRQKRGVA